MPAKARKIAPYTLAAQAGQGSLLDLFDEAPVQAVRREPVIAPAAKPAVSRKPAAKPDPEASLLNLLFEEPANAHQAHIHRDIPPAQPVQHIQHQRVSVSDIDTGLLEEIDTLERRLQSARARFDDPALKPSSPPLANNQNIQPPAPLSHPARQAFRPEFWLYLGALVGGGLAVLFGAVFFPLTPFQGWETQTVRALFGAALGTLWGVLPFLLQTRQNRGGVTVDDETQVYTSWQTRGEIIPN